MGFVHVGSLKLFTTAEDGYQQVVEFVEQGDVLGFDALCTGRHPSTAQALEDAWVYSVRVADLFKLCHDVPALDRAVHLATSRQLARRSELADVMAAVAAEVRLVRFLVRLAGQMEALGRSPRRFVLRMTRRDLASQLGVAHETVSRSFTALAQWGVCVSTSAKWRSSISTGSKRFRGASARRAPNPTRRTAAGAARGAEILPLANRWRDTRERQRRALLCVNPRAKAKE